MRVKTVRAAEWGVWLDDVVVLMELVKMCIILNLSRQVNMEDVLSLH